LSTRRVTVFGGTGFLGRRIVRRLLDHGFAVRVAARHSERGMHGGASAPEFVRADVGDDASLAAAVAGAWAVVNAVGLYVERGGLTFGAVHVAGAERVAAQARRAGVARLVHVSGIGADPNSASKYIRARGRGEAAVRHAFPGAIIVRPAVMFGPDDGFLTGLASMLAGFPVFPLFGGGHTKLQPAHVDDVAEAVARIFEAPAPAALYEFGGPEVFNYHALLERIAGHIGAKPVLLPVPFALWRALGSAAEWLPRPPLTRNQVELMQQDTIVSPGCTGFAPLGIAPRGIEAVLGR
jgi:uncharacterized protein YbjT (DUF2867 family)